MVTIEEAQERGYLKAKRIRPAHIDEIINIPADVILYKKADGNIYLKDSNGISSFANEKGYTYLSMVYNDYNDQWATIVEYRKEDLTGRYIKVLKKCLGGATSNYEVGDYLKILSKGTVSQDVYTVEHAGSLLLTPDSGRIVNKEVEIMPEGFVPEKKWCIQITPDNKSVLEVWWKKQDRDRVGLTFKGYLLSEASSVCNSADRSGLFYGQFPPEGFKEITFKEFKEMHPTKPNLPKLNKFPEGGVCWNPTKQLYDYLILRTTASPLPSVKDPYKALAWNSNNIWGVQASSSQPVYDISQLTPFFTTPKEPQKIGLDFMSRPTTDNFEIGKTYYVREAINHNGQFMITKCIGFNTNDKDRINGPYLSNMNGKFNFNKSNTPWIGSGREVCLASEKDTKWLECCIGNKKFIELENVKRNPEPLPDHIKHYPMIPEDCYYPFPDKWCIVVTSYNEDILQEFLEQKSYLWLHYSKGWKVGPGGTQPNYFHFPPASTEPCHSHWKIQKGYTEITTEQFKQYYNSKSNSNVKQQERESGNSSSGVVKIQRPNFEIRPGDPIRATSFRCSKGKINLGG